MTFFERGNCLFEASYQEEALALSEEYVVVLNSLRDRLMSEGSDGVLEGSVFEEQLTCIFVDFRIIRLQG